MTNMGTCDMELLLDVILYGQSQLSLPYGFSSNPLSFQALKPPLSPVRRHDL